MKVMKRSGEPEELNVGKILASIEWASEDLNVSTEEVVKSANVQLRDMMPTSEIQNVLIKVTDDMSSLREPEYDKMSARLLMQKIYHEAFGGTIPISLKGMLKKNIDAENYKDFNQFYSGDEIDELCTHIDYNRNFDFSKAGLTTLMDAYMISYHGSTVECPQTMFMGIAMDVFKNIKKDKLRLVVRFYDALSTFKISLPTPMMKQLRTISTDYASCIKVNVGDSSESWSMGMDAIMKHTMASAGVGIDSSMVASIGDLVRGDTIVHSGKIPVYRVHDSIIQSSSQNGRRGSANEHTFFCDPEIETVLSLKSPKTETAKRIQDMKHAIKFNNFIYRLIDDDKAMYLFSPRKCKEMYENFHDSEKFEEMYNYHVINKDYSGSIRARELAEKFVDARIETGVYYVFNADNANSSSPYKDTITQSNICLEFLAPTKPLSPHRIDKPDIAVCILSGVNMAKTEKSELQGVMKLLVWGLNEIIHNQDHPTPQANAFVRDYAALGIGLNSHAHYLAMNGTRFGSDKALELAYKYAEAMQFYGLQASMEYSRDFDACTPLFHRTTYANGVMPQDRAAFINDCPEPELNWNALRDDIRANGLANSTITMHMPGETSSMVGNQTSGVDPIRKPLTIKDKKSGSIKQYAPDVQKLVQNYDYAFDTKDMTTRYIKSVAMIQQWNDQSISLNTYYNPDLYDNGKIPFSQIWDDIKLANRLGMPTMYYNNINISDAEQDEKEECVGCTL